MPNLDNDNARVNITWRGQNADLPQEVYFHASDADILRWVTEAVQTGIPGIEADPDANFADFVVDRFAASDAMPVNRLMVRPKTPFGV